ncbi:MULTISPECIES: outer membrane lipoprotein [Tepidiphilus]|uniref:Glycine zipper 2TM domain-containing protein n=1 Tax=Tepidiphilus baoligensis TaxID=2698687 RepID=A0ABX1QM83_9PROT|nr:MULTISPECIES: glycine zipper 2TM domain-containing protein [Tepidiphilus]NMH16396.1 glycine zipper 2TM domain-containing protein [Tepidiphilus baoligensis]
MKILRTLLTTLVLLMLTPWVHAQPVCSECGVVDSIHIIKRDSPGVLGAIGGGVAGGLLGSQIGSGSGKTAATVVGVVGGALAGREIERRLRADEEYEVVVRMDDGTYRSVRTETPPSVSKGQRVRIINGALVPD